MPQAPKPYQPAGRPVAAGSGTRRGTRQERGYDARWLGLRAAHLREHPLCVDCEREGRMVAADQVDHVEPFDGPDDPRRLDADNLQSLCASHHARKTAREQRRRRRWTGGQRAAAGGRG
jgi:5-methylcytosine-specific restriction endonuclease McrA